MDASRQLASAPLPAPRLSGGATVSEPARVAIRPPESAGDDALAVHARVLMNDALPRSAAQSHARVARVLAMAANAWHPAHEASLASAAVGVGGASEPVAATIAAGAGQARRLHEQARQAYRMRRHIPEALDHALGAFAADPNDPDIASHAAFLHLRVLPAQPERARQFALHALGGRAAFDAGARVDDWVTFAIASALTGRAADARNAFFTVLALSRDAERSCRLGVHAHAVHGERLREPVEALVDRVRIQGRAGELGGCKPPAARVAIWR